MKVLKISSLIFLLLFVLLGCETQEQKNERFTREMRESMRKVQEATDKANKLQDLLDKYNAAGKK